MKNKVIIRLTESDLHKLIKESVKKIIKEEADIFNDDSYSDEEYFADLHQIPDDDDDYYAQEWEREKQEEDDMKDYFESNKISGKEDAWGHLK